MRVINLKKSLKNSKFYLLVLLTKPHEKHEKESIHPTISSLEDETKFQQKFIIFYLPLEEESEFLHTVAIHAGPKFQSNLQRKQIFVDFND